MSDRPLVRRTYGKSRPLMSSSSSSMLFHDDSTPSSSSHHVRSSSPPSSDPLLTPPPSSPPSSAARLYEGTINENHEQQQHRPFALNTKSALTNSSKSLMSTQSTLKGFFVSQKRRRPLEPTTILDPTLSPSSPRKPKASSASSLPKHTLSLPPKNTLQQTHLTHLPLLHTCQECQMSYVRASDDEGLHARHHARVVRGIVWDQGVRPKANKGKEREAGWRVVSDNIQLGPRDSAKGRIIVCDASWGGHNKLSEILSTVDTVLSSPPLPSSILSTCKIFLFLTASPPPSSSAKRPRPLPRGLADPKDSKRQAKERVVAVVVAQPIKWAMRVLKPAETIQQVVDSGGGVLCDPTPLDTPLGIHRLFTVPAYRSLGLARLLLDASCRETVYGCVFQPGKGQVAFSQPTDSGRKVMESWGGGAIRVFVDDESQL
ncbi:hypothetical protein BCR39DRAFT_589986 [Naematelia encephala]|uniref:N-acetyltransferase ESCO acetyl-transferase domain-containing protein n=1 Tax=Naematelia encephala TaxID=71784 RepID=A0A1Y2ATG1_9TREE|nr:hypothetical protein BCR39DRAFT_589986 [Naematelia encephala]